MGIYLAGIDLGTTGAKAMIFDHDGHPIAGAYREYPCIYPKPGWVEQNPDLLVEATMEAMGQAVKDSGIQSQEIASISLSAQRCCGIFLDGRETLLRPMISWQDNRTPVEVEEIASLIEEADYYQKTGFPNSTTWLLSKILWVRKNEPKVWEKTRRVVQMHDYFLRALGVEDYYVDHNDAGFFGFFNSTSGTWDQELLDLFEIPKDILTIPEKSGTRVGEVSAQAAGRCGLAPGTPISVGAGDQSAGAVGAGIVQNGRVSVSLGTAGAVTAYLDKPFRDPAAKTMVTSHPIHGCWLLEGYQAAAASVYRWYRDEFGSTEVLEADRSGVDFYELMNTKVDKVPPGANGLLVMPYFAGAATPRYNPAARGMILGLTFAHDRFAVARAFMEGICMDMRDMLNSMKNSGVNVNEARILGGPTRSEVWNQIQANVYGIPVSSLKVSDATVLGAAVLGGVGAGVFTSIQEGAEKVVRLEQQYEPDTQHTKIYDTLYGIYRRTFESLESNDVFSELASIQV
ncbi:MAG: FGGY family carbohydrate kinase [Desulfobacterales bacterium]|jgi:xylulokinase